MKKLIAILVVLVAVLSLVTCQDDIKYGGTIEVTNNFTITVLGVTGTTPIEVTVVKDLDTKNDNKKVIDAGETVKWHFEKDGVYTVGCLVALYLKPVSLVGGNTVKLTIPDPE